VPTPSSPAYVSSTPRLLTNGSVAALPHQFGGPAGTAPRQSRRPRRHRWPQRPHRRWPPSLPATCLTRPSCKRHWADSAEGNVLPGPRRGARRQVLRLLCGFLGLSGATQVPCFLQGGLVRRLLALVLALLAHCFVAVVVCVRSTTVVVAVVLVVVVVLLPRRRVLVLFFLLVLPVLLALFLVVLVLLPLPRRPRPPAAASRPPRPLPRRPRPRLLLPPMTSSHGRRTERTPAEYRQNTGRHWQTTVGMAAEWRQNGGRQGGRQRQNRVTSYVAHRNETGRNRGRTRWNGVEEGGRVAELRQNVTVVAAEQRQKRAKNNASGGRRSAGHAPRVPPPAPPPPRPVTARRHARRHPLETPGQPQDGGDAAASAYGAAAAPGGAPRERRARRRAKLRPAPARRRARLPQRSLQHAVKFAGDGRSGATCIRAAAVSVRPGATPPPAVGAER